MSIRKRIWNTPAGEEKFGYEVGYTCNGKRQRKLLATKKEAEAFETQAKAGVANGTHTPDAQSVTIAVAAQQWLDDCDPVCERATVVAYAQHVRLQIVPRLGAVRLSQLTVPVVAQFLRDLRSAGVSNALIRKVRISLGAIVALAQENGLVAQNVVRAKRRERQNRAEVNKRAEVGVDIPLPAEVRAILPCLQGRLRTLILTAAFTGLRWSELRGLPWSNVDLKAAELKVTQRIDRFGATGLPKSAAGNRTVPLPPLVVNALREHKLATGGQGLVFANSKGLPQHYNTVIEFWQAAQVAAGVVDGAGKAKYSGLHALRHFFASWCINRKADGGRELPLKTVQGWLGHSSVTVTADVYSHLFPRQDDAAELAAAESAFLAG